MTTLGELPGRVLFVGEVLGLEEQAGSLAEELRAEIGALAESRPEYADPPRVLFVISVRDGAPLAAGANTVPDEIIEAAGAVNAAGFDGFKPMNAEAVIAAAPDLLLMTFEHAEALGSAGAVLDRPELALTPAGEAGRILTLPALTILGREPRTAQSIGQLRNALSP